jgi:F-type H+-transporting ATPase subunit delta
MIPYVLTASEDEESLARATADIESLEVARVYGEALLNAAEQAGQVEEVLGELDALLEAAQSPNSDLRKFFASGVIGRATRAEVIRKVFEGRVHPLVLNLLLVINDHERSPLLPAIVFEAKELRDRRARRLPVFVHAAVPLADDQLERIRQAVRKQLQLEPLIEVKVEPELLGGVLLRVGDWVFDGTVHTRLMDLRNQLIERSSYDIQSQRVRFLTPESA